MNQYAQKIMAYKPGNIEELDRALKREFEELAKSTDASNDVLMDRFRGLCHARDWLAKGGRYRHI